jgi:hypothetical protein
LEAQPHNPAALLGGVHEDFQLDYQEISEDV